MPAVYLLDDFDRDLALLASHPELELVGHLEALVLVGQPVAMA